LVRRHNPFTVEDYILGIGPVLTVTQVYALADAVGLRYRALILLAAFTSLRWAELAALRPEDIDLEARTVRVTRQLHYHGAGHWFGPPKSRAGVRVVDFPKLILSDVREHLSWLPSSTALIFASSTGSPLAHSNFRRRVWLCMRSSASCLRSSLVSPPSSLVPASHSACLTYSRTAVSVSSKPFAT
jgi:integrase